MLLDESEENVLSSENTTSTIKKITKKIGTKKLLHRDKIIERKRKRNKQDTQEFPGGLETFNDNNSQYNDDELSNRSHSSKLSINSIKDLDNKFNNYELKNGDFIMKLKMDLQPDKNYFFLYEGQAQNHYNPNIQLNQKFF